MKRTICILAAVLLTFTFCACKSKDTNNASSETPTASSKPVKTEPEKAESGIVIDKGTAELYAQNLLGEFCDFEAVAAGKVRTDNKDSISKNGEVYYKVNDSIITSMDIANQLLTGFATEKLQKARYGNVLSGKKAVLCEDEGKLYSRVDCGTPVNELSGNPEITENVENSFTAVQKYIENGQEKSFTAKFVCESGRYRIDEIVF